MTLRAWLDSAGRSPEWLAGQLGAVGYPVDPRTVRRWMVGTTRPRNPEHLRLIEQLSRGKVTSSDVLFKPTPRRLRPGRPPIAA